MDVHLTWQSERTGIENNWYALTGRVVPVKVEADGDLHIALQDATGDKLGIVVVEVPSKPQWCEIRQTVLVGSRTRFPLHIRSSRKLTTNETPIITVIGKAFWDIGHAPKDQSKPQKVSAGLRCMGDSSGNEADSPVTKSSCSHDALSAFTTMLATWSRRTSTRASSKNRLRSLRARKNPRSVLDHL
jgi:hypothetical protein